MEFSGEDFVPKTAKVLDAFSTEPSKGGRPTVGDNILLGRRDSWLSFFEECWPDVGWQMLQIRKRRSSTIVDVQKMFEPIKGKQRCESADVFLRGLFAVAVSAQQLIRQRIESSKLRFELQDMQTELPELERSLREASIALKQSNGEDRVIIAAELRQRAQLVWRNKRIEQPIALRAFGVRSPMLLLICGLAIIVGLLLSPNAVTQEHLISWPKQPGAYVALSSKTLPAFPGKLSGYQLEDGRDFWGKPFSATGSVRIFQGNGWQGMT